MALIYESTGQYISMVNALELGEAFSIEAGQMADESVHSAFLHAALANVRDASARFTGGAESNDYTTGTLQDFTGSYEIGWEDPSFAPSWDGLPEASANHSFIVAPSFGSSPQYLLMYSTRGLGVVDESDPEAVVVDDPVILATDFMYIATYMPESTSTVYVDGVPWSTMEHSAFTPSAVVQELALDEPHTMLVTMDVDVIDDSQCPSWADTTTLPMDLFQFDFTLVLGPEDATSLFLDDDDDDGDGYGDTGVGFAVCELAALGPDELKRYVSGAGDCDDANAEINPGAGELCNEVDDDCDGLADDDDPWVDAPTWYADDDGDGYGDAGEAVTACAHPSGAVEDDADCDDTSAAAWPGADEVCDGIDNDRDGLVDEADPDLLDGVTWYVDDDGDGCGQAPEISCDAAPVGLVSNDTDCDDSDASAYPDAPEAWYDGTDSDCDGSVDPSHCVVAPPAATVAVVVVVVAELHQAGVHDRVGVVAVALADAHAVAVGVVLVRGHERVAVVVQAVAELDRARVDRRLVVVAVAFAGAGGVPIVVGLVLVDGAVAVVVHAVADLGVAREVRRVCVVAVALAGRDAVAVDVSLVGRDDAVAVVVLLVAELRREGEDLRIEVIAVPALDAGELDVVALAVAVVVEPVGAEAVPVLVEAAGALRSDLNGDGVAAHLLPAIRRCQGDGVRALGQEGGEGRLPVAVGAALDQEPVDAARSGDVEDRTCLAVDGAGHRHQLDGQEGVASDRLGDQGRGGGGSRRLRGRIVVVQDVVVIEGVVIIEEVVIIEGVVVVDRCNLGAGVGTRGRVRQGDIAHHAGWAVEVRLTRDLAWLPPTARGEEREHEVEQQEELGKHEAEV